MKEDVIGRHRTKRWSLVAVAAAAVICGGVVPAGAEDQTPPTLPLHSFGEMVDYPLVFPLPEVTWYEDWFWAARGSETHQGQDLFAAKGAPVVAAAAGTIIRANGSSVSSTEDPDGCCSLALLHDDGWTTRYIHLDNDTPGTDDGLGWGLAPGIEVGAHVEAGQVVGYAGDSGNAEETSPHLHFELLDPDGIAVNPYDALLAAQGRAVCRVADPGPLDALLASTGLIRTGSRGEAVAQLQRLALAFGHDPGPVDGIFGPRTQTAVRALQTDLGVGADGVVGGKTRAAIAAVAGVLGHIAVLDPDGRTIYRGAVGGDVADLQALLASAGHDPGPADGVFGALTQAAVKALQARTGIAADGIVGSGTRLALARVLRVRPLISCPA